MTNSFCCPHLAPACAATQLGLPYPPAYLAPGVKFGKNIIQGVNYASAAAGILDSTGYNYVSNHIHISRVCFYNELSLASIFT